MSEKELLQRAESYAREIYADCDLSDIGVQDEINALALNCMCFAKVLMEDCCLVEKSKVIERYDEAMLQSLSYSRIDIASGNSRKVLLEYLFGKELFNQDKQ